MTKQQNSYRRGHDHHRRPPIRVPSSRVFETIGMHPARSEPNVDDSRVRHALRIQLGHPPLQFVPIRDPEREVFEADAAFIKRTHLSSPVVSHDRYGDTRGVHQRSGLEGFATRAIHQRKTHNIVPPGELRARSPKLSNQRAISP